MVIPVEADLKQSLEGYMAILAQCPTCRTKQKVNNYQCRCGEDLGKAKKANRVQ